MPVYEFTCPDCKTRFDMRRRMSERNSQAQCPNCQGLKAARRISMPVVFSNSGSGQQMEMASQSTSSGCSGCVASSCAGCR